jgi:outer membrane protein assembly factor BamD
MLDSNINSAGLVIIIDARLALSFSLQRIKQNMRKIVINIVTGCILLAFLGLSTGCSKKENQKTSAEASYLKSLQLLKDRDYLEAAKAFEKIDDDFPFSKWSSKAQVMSAYSYYKEKEYIEVARIVDDFILLSPKDQNMAYMLYLKGMSYYDQIPNLMRSQELTREASAIFRELIARFPNSAYVSDVKEKLIFIDNHLAGALMASGRYNIKEKNYVGAIDNFREVVTYYHQTDQAPEAYFRLIEIYYKLGIKDEAKKIAEILQSDYNGNIWNLRAQEIIK